jgi:hypothetical protein
VAGIWFSSFLVATSDRKYKRVWRTSRFSSGRRRIAD